MTTVNNDWPALPPGANSPVRQAEDDWELLSSDEDVLAAENDSTSSAEEEKMADPHGRVIINHKLLHHAASSPNLRVFAKHVTEADEDSAATPEQKVDDASSFAMVSTVDSVWSTATGGGKSFRDALFASPIREDGADDAEEAATSTKVAPSSAPRRYRKPKIVVAPIHRCSKSTGDLRSLALIHEEGDVLGDTDATEYYHRKTKGAQGRSNGMKLRPDEAKRKEFAVNKRKVQRQNSRH
jgi:hypothetical protein